MDCRLLHLKTLTFWRWFTAFNYGFLSEKIKKNQSGDKSKLYEYEFFPSENIETNISVFTITHVILWNSSVIEQLSKRLGSILQSFITHENCEVDQFLELIEFKCDCEPNRNEWNIIRNLECDFELLVAALTNSEIPQKALSDVVFLLIGCEKVPPFGMLKKIEVSFDQVKTFAKISTWLVRLTLPVRDIEKTLKLCL